MKKLLITGASGFIGKGILNELSKHTEYDIFAVTTKKANLKKYSNIHVIEANLLIHHECEILVEKVKPQLMIHLAWTLQGNDSFQYDQTNLEWLEVSLHLLRCFIKNGGRRFIFAGSSSEYDLALPRLSEKIVNVKINLYGKCKNAFTEIAMILCSQQKISFATARFFSVYGENDTREGRAIPMAIQAFLNKRNVICNSPNSIWDYIYIKDAAKATIKIMESTYDGIVNVSTAIPLSMREVFGTIADIMGCSELLTLDNQEMPGQILVSDNTVLRNFIQYTPQISFREGIVKTVDWWKKEMKSW